jgi:putative FmdB family regulatory protein
MTLYTYHCHSCGDFEDWQTMAVCDRSVACPRCGTASRRAVSAPSILGMDAPLRKAHTRNEKGAHEPRVVRKDAQQPHGDHVHGHSHGFHRSSRPSMIGH